VAKGELIELSLLRSVFYPNEDTKSSKVATDPEAIYSGLGRHKCRYALFPHTGDHVAAGVWRQAREFNLMPTVLSAPGGWAEEISSLFSWRATDENFDTPAFKVSEAKDGVVLRINRFTDSEGVLDLQPKFKTHEIWETNLLEEPLSKLSPKDGTLRLSFRPFEVKTLLLRID